MRYNNTKYLFIAFAFIIICAGSGCHHLSKQRIMHDGLNRVYYLHEPENLTSPGTPTLPLVVVLHGLSDDGPDAAKMTQMNAKSDEEGFLVAYPNGQNRGWNAGLCCETPLSSNIDDVGFIDALMTDIDGLSSVDVDQKRIYVAGFSNGAMMAQRVGCELAHRIAAVAAVAGPVDSNNCTPAAPVSVIAIHGQDDQRVLYNGGQFPPLLGGQSYPGAHDSTEFWRIHNSCSPGVPQQVGPVQVEQHTGGANGTEVVLYTIPGGNHSWPGGRRVSPLGEPPMTVISATDFIWEFFEQHPKP